MQKRFLLAGVLATTLIFTGCASYQRDSHGFNAGEVDKFITLNKTTMSDVRALFGTPTVYGVTESDGKTVLGYAFVGNNEGANFMRNWGKGMLTFGLGSSNYDYTIKNVYFKFDDKNRVTDIKKAGYAYLTKHRLTFWNECEVKLTDAEINSSIHYAGSEICDRYAKDVAKTKGIAEKDVDRGEEFPFCNISCHAIRGAMASYGKFKMLIGDVKKAEGDGTRADEVFGKDVLRNQ